MENVRFPQSPGWIEVICGSMFSGKTEELIRRLRRAEIARQHVQIFKPRRDDRYDRERIVSHSLQTIRSEPVERAAEILERVHPDTHVVGVDEVQFLGREVVGVCEALADKGKRVIAAGLDQDYLGRAFEPMPELLCVAEYITKMLAICVRCGALANRSQRLTPDTDRVVVGGGTIYEARCRACYNRESATAAEASAP